MAIERVNKDLCIGCGNCVATCPVDVFRMDKEERKAKVVYPQDCGCCIACYYDCPTGAIVISPEQNFESSRSW